MHYVAKNRSDILFLKQVKKIFKSKAVLTSIFVTLFLLIVFDFLSKIPMPGLTIPNFNDANANTQSFLSILNLLGGGGLKNLSLFACGIAPYITTQIIIQLLSADVIPPLARLTKNGQKGQKKISMITKILTLPFTIVQAYSIIAVFQSQGAISSLSGFQTFFYIVLMSAGTYIAIFFSDIITKKGVGNGVTNIILAGIISQLFGNFSIVKTSIEQHLSTSPLNQMIAFIFYIIFYFLILWTITFISLSTRKIPIQQIGQSLIKEGDDLPYLPFKLNTAGVIPVIFASSLITLPLTIAEIVRSSYAVGGEQNGFYIFANAVFNFNNIGGIINYMFLIVLFTFFYSNIQLNPKKISTDFMKNGSFILGVKIGTTTEKYISKVLYRINWIGGPFLALVTALPYIVSYASQGVIPSMASIGGTGIIIMVSGSIDLWDSIASASTTSSYTIKRKKIQEFDDSSIYVAPTALNNESGDTIKNDKKDLLW